MNTPTGQRAVLLALTWFLGPQLTVLLSLCCYVVWLNT